MEAEEPKVCLPPEVARRLANFIAVKATGEFSLDIKDGRILGWRVTERGQAGKYAMT